MAVDFGEKSEILRDDIYHEEEEVDPSLVFNPLHVVYFFQGSTWLECTLELDFDAPWLSTQ